MKIIGLHIWHDASASLIDNWKLVYAISEERISRVKNHTWIPYLAIEKILTDQKLNKDDIDIISIWSNFKLIWAEAVINIYKTRDLNNLWNFSNKMKINHRLQFIIAILKEKILGIKFSAENEIQNIFKNKWFNNAKVEFYGHHLSHAASAYYASWFKDSIILTQDWWWDKLFAGAYLWKDNILSTYRENKYTSTSTLSLANIYATITHLLWFKRNKHEWKITWLAAYWNKYINWFNDLIELDWINFSDKQNFKWSFFSDWFHFLNWEFFKKKSYFFIKNMIKNETKEDIAYSVQKLCENTMVDYVNNLYKEKKFKNICLAWWLFANVRINQVIEELDFVENLFVYPNMWDGWLATWSAYLSCVNHNIQLQENKSMYLWNEEDSSNLKSVLWKFSDKVTWEKKEDFEKEIAQLISDKVIVWYFSWKMEFWPRALCHRSMLIDTRDRKVNDIVNKRLKRTEFMPFAPVILEEYLEDYFENIWNKKLAMNYMTITADVKKEMVEKIPAVVHVDNTARPQIINIDNNPIVYNILTEYNKITGIPLFVNTSFNIHEEPIVSSYEDAIKSLLNSCVDVLCFDDVFVRVK